MTYAHNALVTETSTRLRGGGSPRRVQKEQQDMTRRLGGLSRCADQHKIVGNIKAWCGLASQLLPLFVPVCKQTPH